MKDFVYLSDTFKYISHYRKKGHQIGRKIGDMLEILTLAAINHDDDLMSRVRLEPKIEGFSGAGHKVEFGLYKLDNQGELAIGTDNLIGFIECKKVGVEQTINSTFKKIFGNKVPYDTPLCLNFNPQWADKESFEIVFRGKKIFITRNGSTKHYDIAEDHRYIFGLTIEGKPFFVDNDGSLRDVEDSIRACKILEIDSYDEKYVYAIVNDCLTGPQTPEKAKQASFVALDVRKKKTGMFDMRDNESECVSVLVITEFAHWEPKSINMINACIDYNLVVDDSIIIRAFEVFEEQFGEDFLPQITKEMYMTDDKVRKVADSILEEYSQKIFKEMNTGEEKTLTLRGDSLIVS